MQGAQRVLAELKPLVILEVSRYSARFGYTMHQLYDYMAAAGYSYSYSIDDTPGHWKVSGPLTAVVEGQILFRHPDGDCTNFTWEVSPPASGWVSPYRLITVFHS